MFNSTPAQNTEQQKHMEIIMSMVASLVSILQNIPILQSSGSQILFLDQARQICRYTSLWSNKNQPSRPLQNDLLSFQIPFSMARVDYI